MAEIIKPKDWGFGEMMDTEEIEEAEKDYQYIFDEVTAEIMAKALGKKKEDYMPKLKEKEKN